MKNVVPIHDEAAHALRRRTIRFRWFVAGLTILWLSILVPAVLFTPLPPLGPFIALAALVILAEHRFILFGDETAMSAAILVSVYAVATFSTSAPLVGAVAVVSLGGVYVPHVLRGQWTLIAANVSVFGITAATASATLYGLDQLRSGAALTSAVVVAVYWLVNAVLIGVCSAVRSAEPAGPLVRSQIASDSIVTLLAFAVMYAVLAASRHPAGLGMTVLVFALACFELGIRYRSRVSNPQGALVDGTTLATAVALPTACAATGTLTGTVAGLLLISAVALVQRSRGHSSPAMIAGAVACFACFEATFVTTGSAAIASTVGIIGGFLVISVGDLRSVARNKGIQLDGFSTIGLLIPSRAMLAHALLSGLWIYVAANVLSTVGALAGSALLAIGYVVVSSGPPLNESSVPIRSLPAGEPRNALLGEGREPLL